MCLPHTRLANTTFDVTLILIPVVLPSLHTRSLSLLAFLILTLLLSLHLNLTRPLIMTPTLTLIPTFLLPLMIMRNLSLLLLMLILRLFHPFKRCLSPLRSPFASLELPPIVSLVYKVSYDAQGLPVTFPLPFPPSQSFNPLSTALASSAVVFALFP